MLIDRCVTRISSANRAITTDCSNRSQRRAGIDHSRVTIHDLAPMRFPVRCMSAPAPLSKVCTASGHVPVQRRPLVHAPTRCALVLYAWQAASEHVSDMQIAQHLERTWTHRTGRREVLASLVHWHRLVVFKRSRVRALTMAPIVVLCHRWSDP